MNRVSDTALSTGPPGGLRDSSDTTLVAPPAKAAEQGDTPKTALTSPAPKRSVQKGRFWEAATAHAQFRR